MMEENAERIGEHLLNVGTSHCYIVSSKAVLSHWRMRFLKIKKGENKTNT